MAKLIFPAHNDELSPELLKETNLNWSVKYEDNRASSDDYERTSMSIFVTKDVIPEDAGDLDIIKSLTYQCSSEYEHCMKDTGFSSLSYWNVPMSEFEAGGTYYWQIEYVVGGETFWDDANKFTFGNHTQGCMDENASNYNENATEDDGSCIYVDLEFDDEFPIVSDDDDEEEVAESHQDVSTTSSIGSISTRVFGADIPIAIKRKLEARQLLNSGNRKPNELITSAYFQGDNKYYRLNDPSLGLNLGGMGGMGGIADLTSRTPFIRMWTAVQIQEAILTGEIYTKKEMEERTAEIKKEIKEGFSYRKSGASYKKQEVVNHDRNIYILGTNNVETISNETNQSRTLGDMGRRLLPDVGKIMDDAGSYENNQFLLPPAGITSVTTNTEGSLGTTRKTSVAFKVNNFHDYDQIYSRFFMRPGAQIFVDFGWSSFDDLYDPKLLVYDEYNPDGLSMEEILYGENGIVTKALGDMDVVIGYVTNHDSKVNSDGSVDCTVEIMSKNSALLSHSFEDNKARTNKIVQTLDSTVINYAAKHFGKEFLTPNKLYDVDTVSKFNNVSFQFAKGVLSAGGGKQPSGENELTIGVWWKKIKIWKDGKLKNAPSATENIYINWGLFEDLVLNNELGVGKSGEDVQSGDDMSVRFDSSNSFMVWDETLDKAQKTNENKKKALPFLYPTEYHHKGRADGSASNKTKLGYNVVQNKIPNDRKDKNGKFFQNEDKSIGTQGTKSLSITWNKIDQKYRRIPVREIYINLATIKEAFKGKNEVKAILQSILSTINKQNEGITDLQLSTNKTAQNEIAIVDRNYLDDIHGVNGGFMEKLFLFKPHSPDSIIKEMDLSFTMPQNGIQNIVAIQSSNVGSKVWPATSAVDSVLALTIQKYLGGIQSRRELGVSYLPVMGNYTVDKFRTNSGEGVALDSGFYDYAFGGMETGVKLDSSEKKLFKGGTSYSNALSSARGEAKPADADNSDEPEGVQQSLTEETDYYGNHIQLASSITEYYNFLAKSNYFQSMMATVIPIKLTLTIYGISSLNNGDLFRVDYLPKQFRDLVFFQVSKVTHQVTTSGWTTQLETTMRLYPDKKKDIPSYLHKTVYLSVEALLKRHKLEVSYPYNKKYLDEYLEMDAIGQYKKDKRKKAFENAYSITHDTISYVEVYKTEGIWGPTQITGIYNFTSNISTKVRKGILSPDMETRTNNWPDYPTGVIVDNQAFVDLNRGKRFYKGQSSGDFTVRGDGNFHARWHQIKDKDWRFGGVSHNDFVYWWDIDLVDGERYKLIVGKNNLWLVAPANLTDKQIDVIDAVFHIQNEVRGQSQVVGAGTFSSSDKLAVHGSALKTMIKEVGGLRKETSQPRYIPRKIKAGQK